MRRGWRARGAGAVLAAWLVVACAGPQAGRDDADGSPTAAPAATSGAEITLDGAVAISKDRLRRAIADDLAAWRDEGHASALDDAAWSLEQFYRSEGFPFARVEYSADPAGSVPRVGHLQITEGPRTKLASVDFQGNTAFTAAALSAFIEGPTIGLLGDERWFVEQELVLAADAMRNAYRQRGYLRVRIVGPVVTLADDRTWADDRTLADDRTSASARFVIDEGRAFSIAALDLPPTWPAAAGDVQTLDADFVGRPYQPSVTFELQARLLERLGRAGHADPSIRVEPRINEAINETANEVVLAVHVEPGPVVVVGAIRVEGNERTRPELIRKLVSLREGERWTLDRENDSFAALQESGLFESIRIELEGTGEQRDVVVSVVEGPTLELYAEPGYGSYEGPRLQAGIVERNWLGRGYQLGLEGAASTKGRDATLTLLDPRFLDTRVSASISTFFSRSDEPSYTRQDEGVGLTFARQTGSLRTSLGYRFRRTTVSSVDAALAADDSVEDGDVGSIVLSPVYDTRDQLFAPTEGTRSAVVLEASDAALFAEIEFLRASIQHDMFFSLREGTVLAVSARTGVVVPAGDTDVVPISELWFNGGYNSVRSFREGELGPKDADGDPLGGETFSVFSVELRQQLSGALSGALFYDVGNVDTDHSRYLDFRDMRAGIGTGVRYMLPVGPLRFDIAHNPDARRDEDHWVAHFSVGMAF